MRIKPHNRAALEAQHAEAARLRAEHEARQRCLADRQPRRRAMPLFVAATLALAPR